MKKIVTVVVFIALTAVMYGEDSILLFNDTVYTSEGAFGSAMSYWGKNMGKTAATSYSKERKPTTQISNGQWEAVSYMLNLYQHSTGDTYSIILYRGYPYRAYTIICEFTSSTKYVWWAFYS
jgi:hypothetical protein